jgi:hypothetical protein
MVAQPSSPGRRGLPVLIASAEPFRFGKFPVEGGKGSVSGAAGNLQDHTVGEIATDTGAIELERGADDVGLLYDEMLLIEQHLDRKVVSLRRNAKLAQALDAHFRCPSEALDA